jgi:hypothetical protein
MPFTNAVKITADDKEKGIAVGTTQEENARQRE